MSRRQFLLAAGAAVGGVVLVSWKRAPAAAGPAVRGPASEVLIAEFSSAGERLRTTRVPKVVKTDDEWRRQLTPLEYTVTRKFDDEVPWTGRYLKLHDAGIFQCVCCDTAVFSSSTKFDSNTGWPAFTEPLAPENVVETPKAPGTSVVTCRRCDAFLGDLFDDGPPPKGLRYCINSASLRFVPATSSPAQTAVFAGGCFWGVEAVFEHVRGVSDVISGYAGGPATAARYDIVSGGDTGHAESVQVTFDPAVVSYDTLLKVFFHVAHDPTQLNRQGPDVGTQYRSVIFYQGAAQQEAAEAHVARLNASKAFRRPIVTQVVPLDRFYPAEAYHQDYLEHHPNEMYIRINDMPKLDHLKAEYPELWVDPRKR